MILSTELSLEVSCANDSKLMRLFDTSFYCEDQTIENYLVEVLPVNASRWVTFHVQRGFSLVLNSSNLQYVKVSSVTGLVDIPDGIYEFKQSIKPNIHTLSHFFHLRTVDIYHKLRHAWNNLISGKCDITKREFVEHRDKLREIDEYLLAAKFEVEECNNKKKGKELYEFSRKLLEQYTNKCKCQSV